MSYPSDVEVGALMRDFEQDFGVRLPFEDAQRILILYEELCELFDRYGGEGSGLPYPYTA
jgi:hypothetical protein